MNRIDRQIEAFVSDPKELLRWLNKLAESNPQALAAALRPTQHALTDNTRTRDALISLLKEEARAQLELADFYRRASA